MHHTALTDGSAKAAFRSAARSASVPARYIVDFPAFGMSFGLYPREATTSIAIAFADSGSWAGDDGEISATVSPFFRAFGNTGSGGFSAYFWSAAWAESGNQAMRDANETSSRNVRLMVGMAGILGRGGLATLTPPAGPAAGRRARKVRASGRRL